MKLMPIGSVRSCYACAFAWYTASPIALPCPSCDAPQQDLSSTWPHVCGQGHGSPHGGDCTACRTDVAREAKSVEVREWRDRTTAERKGAA